MFAALTLPQYLYLAVVAAYLLMFVLFLRFLLWKRYAERHYWHRRPRLDVSKVAAAAGQVGQPLPFFSILVPARNEADVIERTVEHMAALEYPPERYEVLVITDEKEERAAAESRPALVAAAAGFARRALATPAQPVAGALPPAAEGLLLGLLARLATEGGGEVRRRWLNPAAQAAQAGNGHGAQSGHNGQSGHVADLPLLRQLPPPLMRQLVWETARRLMPGRRWGRGRDLSQVEVMLRRRLPQAREQDRTAAFAGLLAHAIPAVLALAVLRGDADRQRLVRRLAAHAARAHHSLTQEILVGMAEALAKEVLGRLERLAADGPEALEQALAECYREVYPTTQDIVRRKAAELRSRPDRPRLIHVDVPYDFDGELGGRRLGREVPSTKGRALNWGLSFINPETRWCGFYDAESRPDPGVLLYVAYRWLQDLSSEELPWRPPGVDRPVQIFQGPVFQVRNFYEMGPFCKIASLYQALAHDWYLPALFRHLPFVGGTNLFVTADLLRQIGGYDYNSLTEDLELGTRAYLRAGAWPEYLPLPSSEQTPPTPAGFYRQRLRWATGHLQVMDKVRRLQECPADRRRALLRQLFHKGQREWVFYQTATLVPPAALTAYYLGLLDPEVLPGAARAGLNLLSLIYIIFTIYAFHRYSGHLDRAAQPPGSIRGQGLALLNLLLLPLAAFLFPVPYSSALVLKGLGRGPRDWVKTPRTRE